MIKYFFIIGLIAIKTGFALLSPLNQSIKELAAVLRSPQLHQLPSGERIQEIVRTDKGFIIYSDRYRIKVAVIHKKKSTIGPARFKLQFQPPEKMEEIENS